MAAQAWFLSRVRILGWALIAAGVVLVVMSFVITANAPDMSPWPTLGAGFALTGIGVVMLATEGRRRTD